MKLGVAGQAYGKGLRSSGLGAALLAATAYVMANGVGCGDDAHRTGGETVGSTAGTDGAAGSGGAGAATPTGTAGAAGAPEPTGTAGAGASSMATGGCSDLFDQSTLATYSIEISPDEWAKIDAEFHDIASIVKGVDLATYHPNVFHL